MKSPTFDEDGFDRKTFAPFELHDCRGTEWKDVRLSFHDWGWLHGRFGTDTVDGYYLNGYGVEGLVKAALADAGVEVEEGDEEIAFDSEGDTCHIHFRTVEAASRAAELAAAMFADEKTLARVIAVARERGFED